MYYWYIVVAVVGGFLLWLTLTLHNVRGQFIYSLYTSRYSCFLFLAIRYYCHPDISVGEIDRNCSLFAHINVILQEARDFVESLINPCPSERPTAESALFHPWMKARRRLLSRSLSDRRTGQPKVRALKRLFLVQNLFYAPADLSLNPFSTETNVPH